MTAQAQVEDACRAHGSTPAARLDGVTIVVVDDQPDSCELLAALLDQQGAHVVQCGSAPEAIKVVAGAPVDLLIADIGMPEIDGYELMRQVRSIRPHVPAIAVTAYARPEDRHQALSAGYAAYCTKPVDASGLLRTVYDLLSRP